MIQKLSSSGEGVPCRTYRAYLVSSNGHFVDIIELFCQTDEEAINQAYDLAGAYAVELWERGRLIVFIPERTP
jgi:hypothetical protein